MAHTIDTWKNNAVRTIWVWLFIIYDAEINVVNFVFVSVLDSENEALGVTEGEKWEAFIGGTKENTIYLEGTEG